MPRPTDTSAESLERLKSTVRANPRSTAFVALAHGLCDAGRAGEAEDVCRDGLTQHPGLVTGQVALGRALLETARVREAQDVLIDAAKANPDNGDVFRWLGEVALKRQDQPRARAILEYAEELSPYDKRVSELLIEAGGTPTYRAPRPKTDFEHTKVGNARALAERMHEDPPVEEPTIVDGKAALKAWIDTGPDEPVGTNGATNGHANGARSEPARVATPPGFTATTGTPAPVTPLDADAAPKGPPVFGKDEQLPWWRGPKGLFAGGAALLIIAVIVAASTGGSKKGRIDPGQEIAAALESGTLPALVRARDAARAAFLSGDREPRVTSTLAFVEALLARDYGVAPAPDVEAMLGDAERAGHGDATRLATVEATRALLALSRGDLAGARARADKAVASQPDAAGAQLASARVKMAGGDLDGARAELERLLGRAPKFAPAVLDWATAWLDLGDPAAAASALEPLVAREKTHTRAQLLLAEAQRALGDRRSLKHLDAPCRADGKVSPIVLAACAVAAATDARVAGDRGAALRAARAAADGTSDPRVLARAAAALALLGEIDAADAALEKAGKLASPKAPPLAWAGMAVRLGRGEPVAETPLLAKPAGPDQRVIAARVAYAQGGATALSSIVKRTPPAFVAMDTDLAALAYLGRTPGVPAAERAALEALADKGHPVANYALGRAARAAGDSRTAVKRLEKALEGHGDGCAAAAALIEAARSAGRPLPPTHAGLAAVRARNARCKAVAQ